MVDIGDRMQYRLNVRIGMMLAIFTGLLTPAWADDVPNQRIAELHVRGESVINVPADQVSVTLGVFSEASTVHAARAENSRKMQAVITAIKALGLSRHDYTTQHFRVDPIWSTRPKNTPRDWRPKVVSYRTNNRLKITTQSLDIIGEIIADALTAGANQIDSMTFSLADPRRYRKQAITDAMENAKVDAQVLAAASGDRIQRTLSLHLNNSAVTPKRVNSERYAQSRMMVADAELLSAPTPPINIGTIRVSASVSVVYELAP